MERFHESGLNLTAVNGAWEDLGDAYGPRLWQLLAANRDEPWLRPRLSDLLHHALSHKKATDATG